MTLARDMANLISNVATGTQLSTALATKDSEINAALATKGDLFLTINSKATSYTLVLGDSGKQIEMSGGGTLTVPTNSAVAFPVGTSILLIQTGASQVTVAGSAGVTINSTPGLKLVGQWSSALLIKRQTDVWLLTGDTAA